MTFLIDCLVFVGWAVLWLVMILIALSVMGAVAAVFVVGWLFVSGKPIRQTGSVVGRMGSFFRRTTVCKLDQHWNWKRHEPDRGIAGAGECLDCGVKWKGLEPFKPNRKGNHEPGQKYQ